MSRSRLTTAQDDPIRKHAERLRCLFGNNQILAGIVTRWGGVSPSWRFWWTVSRSIFVLGRETKQSRVHAITVFF